MALSRFFNEVKILKRLVRKEALYEQIRVYSFMGPPPPKNTIPVTFSETKASTMLPNTPLYEKAHNPAVFPWEHYVIFFSILTLLLYGVFFREENKLDRILSGDFDYPEEDEIKILNALLYAKIKKLDTTELEEKLKAIREKKNKK